MCSNDLLGCVEDSGLPACSCVATVASGCRFVHPHRKKKKKGGGADRTLKVGMARKSQLLRTLGLQLVFTGESRCYTRPLVPAQGVI